ncbi:MULTISPECIES: hypothetical protein [unclassified Nonomuraea]|uniref:hypothetical protein n=1 Tax=unclassified Nonomuraea TaxID=2593643 RepID=UPI0033ECF8C3
MFPEATFDSLVIAKELSDVAGGASEEEATLFGYLSCLLAVYDGNAPSEWGYSFVATKTIAPFSDALREALRALVNRGLLILQDEGYSITDNGELLLADLLGLARFADRMKYLRAACNSALAIPLPQVGEAIIAEPQLRRALALSSTRPLLDKAGADALYDHFNAVSSVVPEDADLFVPAVVWLTYLASTISDDNGPHFLGA